MKSALSAVNGSEQQRVKRSATELENRATPTEVSVEIDDGKRGALRCPASWHQTPDAELQRKLSEQNLKRALKEDLTGIEKAVKIVTTKSNWAI